MARRVRVFIQKPVCGVEFTGFPADCFGAVLIEAHEDRTLARPAHLLRELSKDDLAIGVEVTC